MFVSKIHEILIFKICEIVEKMKMNIDIPLILIIRKRNLDKVCKIELFFTLQTKPCLSSPFSGSLPFPKF